MLSRKINYQNNILNYIVRFFCLCSLIVLTIGIFNDQYFSLGAVFTKALFIVCYILFLPLFLLVILGKNKTRFTELTVLIAALAVLWLAGLLVEQTLQGKDCTDPSVTSAICFQEKTFVPVAMADYPWAFTLVTLLLFTAPAIAFYKETAIRSRANVKGTRRVK